MLAAEIHETGKTIELKLEIPGMEAKELAIRVKEDAVAISGERRSELRYGKFQRVIPLPARIQNAQVKADYKNGVLSLNFPKAEDELHKVGTVSVVVFDEIGITGFFLGSRQIFAGARPKSCPKSVVWACY